MCVCVGVCVPRGTLNPTPGGPLPRALGPAAVCNPDPQCVNEDGCGGGAVLVTDNAAGRATKHEVKHSSGRTPSHSGLTHRLEAVTAPRGPAQPRAHWPRRHLTLVPSTTVLQDNGASVWCQRVIRRTYLPPTQHTANVKPRSHCDARLMP